MVYAFSSLHKSMEQIEKANDILQKTFKKMQLPNKEQDNTVV